MKKLGLFVVLLCFVLVGITGCDLPSMSSVDAQKTTAMEQEDAITIGGTGSTEKYKITLTGAKTYTEISNNQYIKDTADEGKEFVVLFFDASNISSEDDYLNRLYFSAYADSTSVDQAVLFSSPDDYGCLTGDLAAGKNMTGYLAWEVNKGWKELEVQYKEMTGGKIVFKVQADEI